MPDTTVEVALARTTLAEKKLYKFRSLASDTQLAWLKEIVVGNRIRFSRPSELNDPTEGKPIFCLGNWGSPAYRQQFEEWIWHTQRHVKDKPSKEVFMGWLKTLSKEDHEGFIQEIVEGNQAVIEAKWRILSLSANPLHELLWAHYADSHRGVALVFDASDGEFGIAFKVTYVQDRVPEEISSQNEYLILRTSVLSKRAAWAYEEEYRCVAAELWDPLLKLHQQFLHFDPRRLLGVIFGANTSASDKQTIVAWSKERPVSLAFWQAGISMNGSVVITPYAP